MNSWKDESFLVLKKLAIEMLTGVQTELNFHPTEENY